MKESNLKNNLLKRNNILSLMKKHSIKRINSEALISLEKGIKEIIEEIIEEAKENKIIHGRKTLNKEDIEKALKKEEENLEI